MNMETKISKSRKNILLFIISVVVICIVIVFGLVAAKGRYPEPNAIDRGAPSTNLIGPQDVVIAYCSSGLKGNVASLRNFVTDVPKTFEEYKNRLHALTKEELDLAEKLKRENPDTRIGSDPVVDRAYWQRYLIYDFPEYLAESGYEIERIGNINIKDNDASVHIYFKSHMGIRPEEQVFFLHKSMKDWQIFMISDPYFLAPTFP